MIKPISNQVKKLSAKNVRKTITLHSSVEKYMKRVYPSDNLGARLVEWISIFDSTGIHYLYDCYDNLDEGIIAEFAYFLGPESFGEKERDAWIHIKVNLCIDGHAVFLCEPMIAGTYDELLAILPRYVLGTWEEVFMRTHEAGKLIKDLLENPEKLPEGVYSLQCNE